MHFIRLTHESGMQVIINFYHVVSIHVHNERTIIWYGSEENFDAVKETPEEIMRML